MRHRIGDVISFLHDDCETNKQRRPIVMQKTSHEELLRSIRNEEYFVILVEYIRGLVLLEAKRNPSRRKKNEKDNIASEKANERR